MLKSGISLKQGIPLNSQRAGDTPSLVWVWVWVCVCGGVCVGVCVCVCGCGCVWWGGGGLPIVFALVVGDGTPARCLLLEVEYLRLLRMKVVHQSTPGWCFRVCNKQTNTQSVSINKQTNKHTLINGETWQ